MRKCTGSNSFTFVEKAADMQIEHLAIWTYQLEVLKDFYLQYFGGTIDEHYRNREKDFESYFLSFERGCRLELMQMPGIAKAENDVSKQFTGLIHFAFSATSPAMVDALTEKLESDGFNVVSQPRTTGDGYYESVVLDPDQNRVEIAFKP